MKKVLLILLLNLCCVIITHAVCDEANLPTNQVDCELGGNIWTDGDFAGCTCKPVVETPLDESAGMFAGAIVVMGAYILYRKRKKAN